MPSYSGIQWGGVEHLCFAWPLVAAGVIAHFDALPAPHRVLPSLCGTLGGHRGDIDATYEIMLNTTP